MDFVMQTSPLSARPPRLKRIRDRADEGRVNSFRACLAFVVLLGACQSAALEPQRPRGTGAVRLDLELAVAKAPFESVAASWKQRLDQPYVFVEARGDYRGIGQSIERVFALADEAHIEALGPPFALFYDDPGRVPVDELRMRACLPVADVRTVAEPLRCEVLDSTTVVYAYVGGPYPEVPRAYPGLFAYMRELDWVEAGPIREIYLQDPSAVDSWDQLVTEVQIPATRRP